MGSWLVFIVVGALGFQVSQGKPEGMKALEFLLGHWTSQERVTPPSGEPFEFTLQGENKWILGGAALQIDESFEPAGQPRQYNHIVVLFDARGKNYRMYWFTQNRSQPIDFEGQWQGEKLVFQTLEGSPGTPLRITYEPKSAGAYDATLEVKVGEEFRVRTLAHYAKKS